MDYYLPIFRSVSTMTTIVTTAIKGTSDQTPAAELHAGAWPLIEPTFAENAETSVTRYRNATGTGLTATTTEDLIARSAEGRIESLFVTTDCPPRWGRVDGATGVVTASTDRQLLDADLLDRVVLDTFHNGGSVLATQEQPEPGVDVAALLRY